MLKVGIQLLQGNHLHYDGKGILSNDLYSKTIKALLRNQVCLSCLTLFV